MPSRIKVFAAHVEVLKADTFTAGNVCGCIERTGTVAAFTGTGQGFQNTKWPAVLYSQ